MVILLEDFCRLCVPSRNIYYIGFELNKHRMVIDKNQDEDFYIYNTSLINNLCHRWFLRSLQNISWLLLPTCVLKGSKIIQAPQTNAGSFCRPVFRLWANNIFCFWANNIFCLWAYNIFCLWAYNIFCLWAYNIFCLGL